MCDSVLGLPTPIITITALPNKKYPLKKWKCVIISAWVHPGESVASFVFNGFFWFILSNDAKYLWRLFVFKLIPVLNPDGVMHGNYWSSVAGVDLNRMWIEPDPVLHPSVHGLKSLIT